MGMMKRFDNPTVARTLVRSHEIRLLLVESLSAGNAGKLPNYSW